MLEPPASYLDTIEVAATWTALPRLHAAVGRELAAAAQLVLCHFSHACGQGCCAYFTFAGTADDEAGAREAYARAWRGAMEATLAAGGTISHHHGVGQVRAGWIREEMDGWWPVWVAVRDALDPRGRMNPHALGGRAARP
jgi:alkyldihydroxyacetonephosphate synthase